MNTTVKQAREALEAAALQYNTCDTRDLPTVKATLDSARHNYWNACADFCTKLEFSVDLAEVHEKLVEQGLWV